MKKSILRTLLLSFLGFGLAVALIFPFYANYFVHWKPGMLIWFVMGCVVAGLMIGVSNYALVNVILIRTLQRISDVAGAVSSKDLTQELNLESADMVGATMRSFNSMIQNLRRLISETALLSENVHGSSRGVHAFSGTVRETADEQANRMRDIHTAAQRLGEAASRIMKLTENATTKAKLAGALADRGGSVAGEAQDVIRQMSEGLQSTFSAISELEQDSKQIGGTVAAIEEITRRTHLLAVNAAIEAARAGEQGRGFAVVAEEVGDLSRQTKSATSQIASLLESVRSNIEKAIIETRASSARVQTAVEKSLESEASLKRITESTDSVSESIEEIASASEAQCKEVQLVQQNLIQIGELVAKMVENSTVGTERAEKLEELARDLNDSVRGFKLA